MYFDGSATRPRFTLVGEDDYDLSRLLLSGGSRMTITLTSSEAE